MCPANFFELALLGLTRLTVLVPNHACAQERGIPTHPLLPIHGSMLAAASVVAAILRLLFCQIPMRRTVLLHQHFVVTWYRSAACCRAGVQCHIGEQAGEDPAGSLPILQSEGAHRSRVSSPAVAHVVTYATHDAVPRISRADEWIGPSLCNCRQSNFLLVNTCPSRDMIG